MSFDVSGWRRRLGFDGMFCFGDETCVCQLRFCLLLKPEGFVLAVLLSWQRLHRPRMRCGSLGSRPASTSSIRSIGQWSAMVLGAPHRPWCLPHPSGPSPGQTHRGSLASTRARARRCAFDVYGLRPRVRRLSLAFLHSSHSEPEETRCGQPEVEHTLYIKSAYRQRGPGTPRTHTHRDIQSPWVSPCEPSMNVALGRLLWGRLSPMGSMPDNENHNASGWSRTSA